MVIDPDVQGGNDQQAGSSWPQESDFLHAQNEAIQLLQLVQEGEEGSSADGWDGVLPSGKRLERNADTGLWEAEGAIWVPETPSSVTDPQTTSECDLRLRLLVIAHAGGSGHRGEIPTLTALRQRYWWESLQKDVKVFVGDCLHALKWLGGLQSPGL